MPNKTLHIPIDKWMMVERAHKLVNYHEDKSLSIAFLEMCERIVRKYDVEHKTKKRPPSSESPSAGQARVSLNDKA